MSAQHTQGKLKVVSTYAIPEIRDQEDHFVFAAGSASPQSFVNARRLVACWNACEGLPTDLLENLTLTGDTIAARLIASAPELLEALQVIAAGNTDPDVMVDIARAAIAKVEGDAA